MKNKFPFLALTVISVAMLACSKPRQAIVNPADYSTYLATGEDASLHSCNEDISFWQTRLAKSTDDETSLGKLASLFSARFKLTGVVEDLYTSDSLYQIGRAHV